MGRAHDPVTARDAGGSFKPCGYQLLGLPLRRTPQLAVEVEGGAYEGEVGEGLREVAQSLAAGADLLRVEPQVVGVGKHLLEDQPCLVEPPGPRQSLNVPERAYRERA